jgi:glycine/D-amino acid oxidase-like deaminating enzyme
MIQPLRVSIQVGRFPDVVVVGAGIFGLWAARRAIMAGKRVLVVEKRKVGAGASGGFLGALMPHMPDRWDGKKQFQFEALSSLPDAIAQLEADTGMDCGYRRCGRLMPIRSETSLAEIDARVRGARKFWKGKYSISRIGPDFAGTIADDWLDERAAPLGAQWDDFSARVDPRRYLAALAAFVRAHGELREGADVVELLMDTSEVRLANGTKLSGAEIVVANGWEAYGLLQPFLGSFNGGKPAGRSVKGQALLLEFAHGDDRPILYSDRAHVVPQAGNRIAIGSTSRDDWQASGRPGPDEFDPADCEFHARACRLAPQLANAPVIERWANVRPRNTLAGHGTAPFFGRIPGHHRLTALIGGYKIGVGIAHAACASVEVRE